MNIQIIRSRMSNSNSEKENERFRKSWAKSSAWRLYLKDALHELNSNELNIFRTVESVQKCRFLWRRFGRRAWPTFWLRTASAASSKTPSPWKSSRPLFAQTVCHSTRQRYSSQRSKSLARHVWIDQSQYWNVEWLVNIHTRFAFLIGHRFSGRYRRLKSCKSCVLCLHGAWGLDRRPSFTRISRQWLNKSSWPSNSSWASGTIFENYQSKIFHFTFRHVRKQTIFFFYKSSK